MVTWKHPQVNGGMGNVCTAHPSNPGEFQLGGDLWGWYRTTDASRTYRGQMYGQSGIGSIYARGCRFSLADPATCYVAIGILKSTGGYFGTCNGITLTRHAGPQYGGNLGSGSGGTIPRPVGNLIDVLMAGGVEHIYTAAYNGIMHSTDAGKTWKTIVQSAENWKAVAALDATSVLASKYNGGLAYWKNGAKTTPTSPGKIDDLRVIAGTCWAVGAQGVYQWTGGKLTKHSSASSFFAGTRPVSIDGSQDGRVLLVGTVTPGAKCAGISVNGGKTWKALGGNAAMTLYDGRDYWLKTAARNGWGQPSYTSSQVAVSKAEPSKFLVAGRGGAWASDDGGQSIHPVAPSGNEVSNLRAGPEPDGFAGDDQDWTGWHTPDAFQTTDHVKQSQTGLHGVTQTTVGGHIYSVTPGEILMDGQSIADDVFKGGCVDPTAIAVSTSGKILVGQYGGSLLLGTP